MMGLQQVSSPLGVVFGYILTYIIRTNIQVNIIEYLYIYIFLKCINIIKIKWQWSFIIQAITLAIHVLLFLFVSEIYFSPKITAQRI
jgi:hypothetical protein